MHVEALLSRPIEFITSIMDNVCSLGKNRGRNYTQRVHKNIEIDQTKTLIDILNEIKMELYKELEPLGDREVPGIATIEIKIVY